MDLHINRGDSIVIQGPNGCGKSTLIKLLNGIIFPSEGKYFYQGHEINEKALKNSQFAKWFHQQMGYVFQNADTQLFCGSVEEEITFGPVQMGLSEAEIKKNRRLPALIWIGKTKRETTLSSEWRREKGFIGMYSFIES